MRRALAGGTGGGEAGGVGATTAHERREEGQGTPPSMPSRAVLKEEGTVLPMPLGAFVKEEEIPSMPPGAFFNTKEEAVVKREHALIV